MPRETLEDMVDHLRWALQHLSQPADAQLEFFGSAGDMANEFGYWYATAREDFDDQLTPPQRRAIGVIDSLLGTFSSSDDGDYLTDEALHSGPEWDIIRDMAKDALRAFGWPTDGPPEV